ETTWESLDHLWNNNQQMFWIQLLIPLAALIVVTRLLKCVCCVVPFLSRGRRRRRRRLRARDHDAEPSGNLV
nr:transframe fusion protein [Venezuelan equine encephalitis virus]